MINLLLDYAIMPEAILALGILLTLLHDLFSPYRNQKVIAGLSLMFILASGANLYLLPEKNAPLFSGLFQVTAWDIAIKGLCLFGAGVTILISHRNSEHKQRYEYNEYYLLIMMATLGAMLMLSSPHFLMIFLGLEILSLSSYVLCTLNRQSNISTESGLKYFVMGSMGTAFILYGMSFIYGASKSLDIYEIIGRREVLNDSLLLIGMFLLLCGFAAKIAIVPLHMWAPDVYQGSPTSVTVFISFVPKFALFTVLAKILLTVFIDQIELWQDILLFLSLLSMILGNILALNQDNLKRILAYSSISHSGLLLFGIVTAKTGGLSAMTSYLFVYSLAGFGAFTYIILMSARDKKILVLEDLRGLGRLHPFAGFAMLTFLLSMAGIPATAGFIAKFQLFYAGIDAELLWPVSIGLINSVVAVYYYFKIVKYMYFYPPSVSEAKTHSLSQEDIILRCVLFSLLLAVISFGVFSPNYLIDWSHSFAFVFG